MQRNNKRNQRHRDAAKGRPAQQGQNLVWHETRRQQLLRLERERVQTARAREEETVEEREERRRWDAAGTARAREEETVKEREERRRREAARTARAREEETLEER
jgi:hypothetical protein